ncbi:MAG: hypothetical protein ACREBJ_08545 [Nitrosotalea sp.]
MKTSYYYMISITCIVIVGMVIFGINGSNHQVSIKEENDSKVLLQINQQALMYEKNGDRIKLYEETNLMSKKLQDVASKSLGIDNVMITLNDTYDFPFVDPNVITNKSRTGSIACDIPTSIPNNLQKIRQTELFQMFANKYSRYGIGLSIMDERRDYSIIHYGLYANDANNNTAFTYFHINSCTGQIMNPESYFLGCHDRANNNFITTHNKNNIIASLKLDSFCKIPLDPWQQMAYNYEKDLSKKLIQIQMNHTKIKNNTAATEEAFFNEMSRISLLGSIANSIVEDTFDSNSTQKAITDYNSKYGKLPDELSNIIKQRG